MAPRLVVTPGDPRGIGPEVTLAALHLFASERPAVPVEIIGPDGPLDQRELAALADRFASTSQEHHDDAAAGSVAGRSIERAVALALEGGVHAIVTAPLHKPSLHAAGWLFPGQTEMLADLTGGGPVGMLMAAESTKVGGPIRVLLATTHLPLASVASTVTQALLEEQVSLLDRSLRNDWGFTAPTIALCGLNPHASDGGLFGDEEARIFAPAVEALRASGVDVAGPLPADTVFTRALSGDFDAVVAPYHDVGMAAFKTVSFGTGVNVTLGLPFIRTSPDHGTAFDIAGTGTADPTSMLEALRLAWSLANQRFDTSSADV